MVKKSSPRAGSAMSPSTKSKPASDSSPKTGETEEAASSDAPASKAADAKAADASASGEPDPAVPPARVVRDELKDAAVEAEAPPAKSGRADKPKVAVELEVDRSRSASWTVLGSIIGALLIWKLGTVGVWAGIVLVALSAYHAWLLAQTFLYAPGTISITDREVTLPRGLCMPRPVTVARGEVTAVYFLRRSVPWNTAAPVLIVELGPKAMAFPRNWFASEADQRRIVHALLRDKKLAADAA